MSQEEQNASTDENVSEAPTTESESPANADTATAVDLCSGPFHGLVAALLAATVTWGVLHASYPVFSIPAELQGVQPTSPPALVAEQAEALKVADAKNTIFVFGLFGLSLGVFFAGIDSLARKNLPGVLLFGLLGGAIVAVTGCAAGWVGILIDSQLRQTQQYSPLAKTIVLQAVVLGVLGLGMAITLALPYRRAGLLVHCILGCVLGAVLAALVYPVAMSTLIPTAQTESLVPYVSWTRFAWLATTAVLISLVATGLGKRKKK